MSRGPGADAALARVAALARMPDGQGPTPADLQAGYVDTLRAGPVAQERTLASAAMNSPLVSAIYEGPWRQGALPLLAAGMTMGREKAKAVRDLRLRGEQRVLDVACGPGNFSRHLSDRLEGDGLVVGIDLSEPMLARAVADNRGPRVGYVLGDASGLPFADGSFDAVCCYAALYLIDEPERVLREMLRVLAPGGRICVMTSCSRGPRWAQGLLGERRIGGLRMFGRDDITAVLRAGGYAEIAQQVRGFAQFVQATKP